MVLTPAGQRVLEAATTVIPDLRRIESGILAAGGGALGLMIGLLTRSTLLALAPVDVLTASDNAPLDAPVLMYAAAAVAVATITVPLV